MELTDETVKMVALDVVELIDRAGDSERTEELCEMDRLDRPARAASCSVGRY
jgi:hypothetical protein